MKKAISLILALVMCLSLCACGTASKEDMLASAGAFSLVDYRNDHNENSVRANQTYKGKIIMFVGHVSEIASESIKVRPMDAAYQVADNFEINVSLPAEEIMLLSKEDQIAIVGEIVGGSNRELTLGTAYTIPMMDYVADQIDPMIALFGAGDDDGKIEMTDGSYGFFAAYQEAFPLLTGAEAKEALVGAWTITDKFGEEFEHTFYADGTAATTYKGNENACYWLVDGEFVYWGTSSRAIDTSRNTRMEVRRLNDSALIFFENDTNSYNGMTYKMDSPYAVLIKK